MTLAGTKMTEYGITKSLRDARNGDGYALGDEYRIHLFKQGWIDERQNITAEGLRELDQSERAA